MNRLTNAVAVLLLVCFGLYGQIAVTNPWNGANGTAEPRWNQWTRIAYDPSTARTLFFVMDHNEGGPMSTIFSNSTWKWDGSTWTETWFSPATTSCQAASSTGPVPHHPYATPFVDTKRHLFLAGPGPCSDNVVTGLTITGFWWWPTATATSATQLTTTATNNGGSQSAVYDSTDDAYYAIERPGNTSTVLRVYCSTMPVGGGTPSGTLNLQQTARGVCTQADNWVTVSTNTPPTGAVISLLVFNSATGHIILFGGYNNQTPSGIMNETWTYDPPSKTWTQQSPAHTPPSSSQIVVGWAGDITPAGTLYYALQASPGQLWAYTEGGDWVQQTTSGVALPINPISMAYDQSRNKLVTWSYLSGAYPALHEWQLPSSSTATGQFRALTHWPSGHVKYVEIAGEVPSVAANGTATVTLTGPGGLSVPITLQEALYSGVSGVNRTDDPFQLGLPLADSAGITDPSTLSLSGSTSVPVGNLATDNGATITVATGAATFTLKKANHNGLDIVDVGSTHIVLTGASDGFVVAGPNPTATYPGNATCLPTPGGTACTTLYKSKNDGSSTCSIEKNGAVTAVLNCTGSLVDGASNSYMGYTVRYYFWANKTSVKTTVSLRNASYGSPNTFATAYKGHQGFELRLVPNISGTLNYAVAADSTQCTSGVCSGTMTTSNSLVLYQAQTSYMGTNGNDALPLSYTPDTGYTVTKDATSIASGDAITHVGGWADVSSQGGGCGNGCGIEIGVYQLSGYWPKSLEFNNGTDVRIGIWARENSIPYYQPYAQYSTHNLYLNFHASALASPANEFTKFQNYLVGRASLPYYNSTNALLYPLLDTTAEGNFYTATAASASPSVSYTWSPPADCMPRATRYHSWPSGGGGNQVEFRWSNLMNFLRYGLTGCYLDSLYFYDMERDKTWPRADFSGGWRSKTIGADIDSQSGFPMVGSNSVNNGLGYADFLQDTAEHEHNWGINTAYEMTGDESLHDAITDGYLNYFLDTRTGINNSGAWSSRSTGSHLSSGTGLQELLLDSGDSTNSASVLSTLTTVFNNMVKPQLSLSGYGSAAVGVSPVRGVQYNGGGDNQCLVGTSLSTQAIPSVGGNQSFTIVESNLSFYVGTTVSAGMVSNPNNYMKGVVVSYVGQVLTININWTGGSGTSSSWTITTDPLSSRATHGFMESTLSEGVFRFAQAKGPGWSDYRLAMDLLDGVSRFQLTEMFVGSGSSTWSSNGFRYSEQLDTPNACNAGEFQGQSQEGAFNVFWIRNQLGYGNSWQGDFKLTLQALMNAFQPDDFGQYQIANSIYAALNGGAKSLQALAITSFTDNGGGSYTIGWNTPASTDVTRVKWGTMQIVDWIGFNPTTNTFIGDPTVSQNWFASAEVSGVPAPVAGPQSMTVSTGQTGLKISNFSVKAMAPAGTGGGSTGGGKGTSIVGGHATIGGAVVH